MNKIKQLLCLLVFATVLASATSTTSENNGKELDKMHGLNAYDYGARQYNPILARWDRIDPLAEKYYDVSLYAYCEDSPVNTFDPDGRNSIKVISKAVYKIGKSVAKNGVESLTKSATYTAAFHGVVKDTKTLLDSNASTWDRTVAGVNLLSEVIGPISFKDAKTIINYANKQTSRAEDERL